MDTSRFVVTDHQWEKMEPHCLGRKKDPGRAGSDARMFLEAVFWIARTGAPWRDLPPVLAIGTPSTAALEIGRGRVFLNAYSMQ